MFRRLLISFWILLLLFLGYCYFFQPELFQQMFQNYSGLGSPYINAP